MAVAKKPVPAPTVKQRPGPKPEVMPPANVRARKSVMSNNARLDKIASQEKEFAKLRTVPGRVSNIRDQAMKSDKRNLTELQKMFVRHWAAGESILSASARAGYSDNGTYAYRLSKDPLIIEIYQREKKLYEASCQMTRKRVMDGFLAAAEMAQLQADPTSMTGAWREIGKMCGYYEPVKKTIDVNINGTVTQKVERLSDDMLLQIIKGQVGAEVFEQDMLEVEGDE